MAFSGSLICPSRVILRQLDTNATRVASGYDDDFREFERVDSDGDNIGEDQRVNKSDITLMAQVSTRTFEREEQAPHGRLDETPNLELTFHFRDLKSAGLVESDGRAKLVPGDLLVRVEDLAGNVMHTFPDPPGMYLVAARPSGFFGGTRNLLVCTFQERRQDRVTAEPRKTQV